MYETDRPWNILFCLTALLPEENSPASSISEVGLSLPHMRRTVVSPVELPRSVGILTTCTYIARMCTYTCSISQLT